MVNNKFSPSDISIMSGISYDVLKSVRDNKSYLGLEISKGDYAGYIKEITNNTYFFFKNAEGDNVDEGIIIIPLVKSVGLHHNSIGERELEQYLYTFFRQDDHVTLDNILNNQVFPVMRTNNRIKSYCEMIANDCFQLGQIIVKFKNKGIDN